MDWNDVVASLPRFGLAEREVGLYVAALRRGRATARELTRDAGVDRVLGYRILDRMRARGLMEVTAERPRRFAPLAPELLVERSLRERRNRLAEDEGIARELTERLSAAATPAPLGASRYQILTGTQPIYAYLQEIVGRAKERVDVMITYRSLRESLNHELEGRVGDFVRRGGRFRLLLEADPRWPATFSRFRKALQRFPNAEVRLAPVQPSRLTLGDASEALLFLVPELRDRGDEQVAVWTNEPGFVAGQRRYFEAAWKAGRRADAGPRRPTRGASRETARAPVATNGAVSPG
jgi:HTH-type transcriptional regulator, sugar sensing transcriptional regulator